MNLKPLVKDCGVNEFMVKLEENIDFDEKKTFVLPNDSVEVVNLLMTEKYLNEEWIYSHQT